MKAYLIRRLIQLIPVLIGVTVVSFSILYFTPGDPAQILAGPDATGEDIANIQKEFGLDRPFHIQYFSYLSGLFTGELRSIRTRQPVLREIMPRFWNTIRLTLVSMVVSIVLGIFIGVMTAVRRNTIYDYVGMCLAILGICTPVFWLGLLLILLFSVTLNWLPAAGMGGIRHMVLPSVTLAAATIAVIARMTRSSMLEVIRQEYIVVARAKGLPEYKVIYKHALRNALLPTVTVIGLRFGYLLGGAVLTESVFAWPGIGRLLVTSILSRDFPVVQTGLLVVAVTFVFVNLGVDLIYSYLNPRIRYWS
jgi:ABC-type dipeptide/oligopeptide/nickel transport system permease component